MPPPGQNRVKDMIRAASCPFQVVQVSNNEGRVACQTTVKEIAIKVMLHLPGQYTSWQTPVESISLYQCSRSQVRASLTAKGATLTLRHTVACNMCFLYFIDLSIKYLSPLTFGTSLAFRQVCKISQKKYFFQKSWFWTYNHNKETLIFFLFFMLQTKLHKFVDLKKNIYQEKTEI